MKQGITSIQIASWIGKLQATFDNLREVAIQSGAFNEDLRLDSFKIHECFSQRTEDSSTSVLFKV